MGKKWMGFVGAVLCCLVMVSLSQAGGQKPPTGTVAINGLVWLKNANCFGEKTWDEAKADAASLHTGMCGLTDGSAAGQWRLPTARELQSLSSYLGQLDNKPQSMIYWSSEESTHFNESAVAVNITNYGIVEILIRKRFHVLPVHNP